MEKQNFVEVSLQLDLSVPSQVVLTRTAVGQTSCVSQEHARAIEERFSELCQFVRECAEVSGEAQDASEEQA